MINGMIIGYSYYVMVELTGEMSEDMEATFLMDMNKHPTIWKIK